MNKIPRASLSVTILGDEDYRVLMSRKGGAETFGVFVALLVVGRERLQQDKARQVAGTESLVFDNGVRHLLGMAQVSERQFRCCLKSLAAVAKETGSRPWMSLDDGEHLVIRSFFKFNTSSGWGGARPGSGRVPTAQDGGGAMITSPEEERYQRYLCSREWAERRKLVLARCDGVCERCHNGPATQVHHLTYIRKYEERPEDLQALCGPCHEFTHGKRDDDPLSLISAISNGRARTP